VYLIRHAVAFDRDRKRWPDDRQRVLTPHGIRKFRKGARGLERLVGSVDCVLTSPWLRARQTAEILTKVAGWPKPIDTLALAPGRTPAQALEALRARDVESVALIGHEPDLSELLAVCLAGPQVRALGQLKKGGAASLCFPALVRPGQASLEWLLTPRVLRAISEPS
jgi:phosphohistidine phosphatase